MSIIIEDLHRIQPFHRATRQTQLLPLSLKALEEELGITVFEKSNTDSYHLIRQLTAKGLQATRVAHRLLLPYLKPKIQNKQEAYIVVASWLHYIKKLITNMSTPDFKISHIIYSDIEMIMNEDHSEARSLLAQLKASSLILWPLCYADHAHLIAFHKSNSGHVTVSILDSNNKTLLNKYLLTKAKPIADHIKKTFSRVRYQQFSIPRQSTRYDCIPACAYFAKAMCLQIDIKQFEAIRQPVNYGDFRLEMASVCADFNSQALHQSIQVWVD